MKHLSLGLRVGLAMAFCAALLAPGALADNGKKPPVERPGNSANAPGHEKQDEVAPPQLEAPEQPLPPPSAAAPAETAPAPVHAVPVEAKEAEPAAPAVPTEPDKPTNSENDRRAKPQKPKPEAKPRTGGSPPTPAADERSRAATAHSKVLICHATGSATNPYVLISVSVNAWSKGSGHGAHADDVFVDWSWPGDPRQKNDALCPASGPAAPTSPSTTTASSTGTTTSSSSALATADDPGNDAERAPTRSPAADSEPTSALPVAKAVEMPLRDVLTTGVRAGHAAVRGTLPFTGLPLWGIALVGLGLVALGLVLHRRAERGPAASRAR
jgi:hypothetical protein